MSSTLLLKFICPIIVLCVVWIWNRKRAERRMLEEAEKVKIPHYEFGVLDNVTKEKISKLPGKERIIIKSRKDHDDKKMVESFYF